MLCKYNIDIIDSVKFVEDLKNKTFVKVEGDNIWSLGYDTKPFDVTYITPKNFPYCCDFHSTIINQSEGWLRKFPECCENHRKLKMKYWFNKENYKVIPFKIVQLLSYTENFIAKNIENELWYKDITDYIEYSIESFGVPNIGGEKYIAYLKHWIEFNKPTDFEFPEIKRRKLLEFIRKLYCPEKKVNADLNILYSTFQKWLKTFPDLPFFKDIKEQLKGKFPLNLVLYEPNHNRFSGITKSKIRTESELIELLINSTKNLLGAIDTPKLLSNKLISENIKYQIELLSEQHKIKQNHLLVDYVGSPIFSATLKLL